MAYGLEELSIIQILFIIAKQWSVILFHNNLEGAQQGFSRMLRMKTLAVPLCLKLCHNFAQECENRGVSIHGVVNAAALKAIAAYKQVGARGEHYGTTVLVQCRSRLEPPLPESAIGKHAQYSLV